MLRRQCSPMHSLDMHIMRNAQHERVHVHCQDAGTCVPRRRVRCNIVTISAVHYPRTFLCYAQNVPEKRFHPRRVTPLYSHRATFRSLSVSSRDAFDVGSPEGSQYCRRRYGHSFVVYRLLLTGCNGGSLHEHCIRGIGKTEPCKRGGESY